MEIVNIFGVISHRTHFCVLIALLFVLSMNPFAQQVPDFHPPMDLPMQLSGGFGELRSNHFHSGIDIRTGGVEGKPVYSIADGWVSRIRISPLGFGKAIYIDHPEGYTSVYAHMLDFRTDIQQYIRNEQYRRENFDIDIYLPKSQITVKRGERIGRSGNSGSSGGPHLHFEIRDAATQHPLDPTPFGIKVKDLIRPAIKALRVYAEGDGSTLNGGNTVLNFPVLGWGLTHRIEPKDTIRIRGAASFGLNVHDMANDAPHRKGVSSIEAFCDSARFYGHAMKRFSFDETRYINAMIDYAEYERSGTRFIRTHIAPNNRLSVYSERKTRGILRRSPGVYEITFSVSDHNGNISLLKFPVIFEEAEDTMLRRLHKTPVSGYFMTYKHENQFKREDIELVIPGEALYDTIAFTYDVQAAPGTAYAPLHIVHSRATPLHTWCTLRIKAVDLPDALQSKALMVRCTEKGKCVDADGEWKDGWVETRIREFGGYTIHVDTVPPRLHPLNVGPGKVITNQKDLRFRTADNLSGVKTYRLEINGKWALLEYDPKNELLLYTMDPAHFNKGSNTLMVRVADDKGNVSKLDLRVSY